MDNDFIHYADGTDRLFLYKQYSGGGVQELLIQMTVEVRKWMSLPKKCVE
jgi:hypothetical protein